MPKKKMTGRVVSDRMAATVVVEVSRTYKHPKYKKIMRRNKKYKVDNVLNATLDDQVVIEETRPLSKEKRWRVIEIIGKGVK